MQADVHAGLLIALVLGAMAALALLRRRAPTSRQVAIALGLAALVTLAAPLLNHHMCMEGEPRMQWLILGPCLLGMLMFVRSAPWRRVLGAALGAGIMGLSCHFMHLVHEPRWTGNPDWDGVAISKAIVEPWSSDVATDYEELALPAGWLRDLEIWPEAAATLRRERPERRAVRPVWHTRLTGLYRYDLVPLDFWYPGGRLSEAAGRIELRDRER